MKSISVLQDFLPRVGQPAKLFHPAVAYLIKGKVNILPTASCKRGEMFAKV